jgi:predicted DsbA family dithiol-disulfide isomerase
VLAEWMKERFGATVEWLPFDLHPEYPPEGVPRRPSTGRIEAIFESHDLVYNPPPRSPRSLTALRLTEHARAQGLHQPFHDRLMDAYWAEAQDIGDLDVLRALAAEVGVGGADEVLSTDAYAEDVRRATENAHAIGISGIPGFLLDRRLLILGAHSKETFERAFEQLDVTGRDSVPSP